MKAIGLALGTVAFGVAAGPQAAPPIRLLPGSAVAVEFGPADAREVVLGMRSGESADVAVLQQGIDVVVEAFSPAGALLETVDSPNGRQGDEPVSVFARNAGLYRFRIRPISPDEPAGRITVRVAAFRDAAQTRRLLAGRRRARTAAAAWLRRRNAPLPASGNLSAADPLPPFDALAAGARIVGLGEATHGSREFGDLRLSLVQRLVRRHGYRLVAVEDSGSRWRAVEAYVAGEAAEPGAALEWGWSGRRSRRELLDWVRRWNLGNPGDRVRIVGVDPQDNRPGIELLGPFLEQAYGPAVATAWRLQAAELAAADEQTDVFGNSRTSAALRQFLQHVASQLGADGPLLRMRFGDRAYARAMEEARDLAAFADFNSGDGTISHSRDWYMALGIMRAVEEGPVRPKTIFWGHNAHVSAAPTPRGPAGAMLRQAFGCGYRAVAATFGQGAFIALVPDDPDHRLAATTLPAAAGETVERVLAQVRPGAHLSAWSCREDPDRVPEWLRAGRPLRSLGGLHSPGAPASGTYHPYRLTAAFDGIAYLPGVSAEEIPLDRPVIPHR